MSILDIYRYLRNYITVSISGGFTERFINLCNKENIYFWDSVYKNGELKVNMYCKDFRRLTAIRRKSGVRVKIIKKIGLLFWIRENRKRKALAVGMLCALITMTVMNNFVWSIDIVGTESIGKNEVIEIIKSTGLDYGTFVPAFDEAEAGRTAVNLSDGKILWLSVNIKGSKATVEVRDYVNGEKEEKEDKPCNIVADFDGVILSSYTHSGICVAHNGTAVKKGDLLISGIAENENGAVDYLCADGEITALRTVNNESIFKHDTTSSTLNQRKCTYRLKLFGLDIPLSLNLVPKDSKTVSYTKYLTFDNNLIPIGIEKLISYQSEKNSTSGATTVESVDRFTCNEYISLKNSTIVKADYVISSAENKLTLSGKYDIIDFIGEKSAIIKEN